MLKWTQYTPTNYEAETPFGTYYEIVERGDKFHVGHEISKTHERLTLKKAQDWAEQDLVERAYKCLLQ